MAGVRTTRVPEPDQPGQDADLRPSGPTWERLESQIAWYDRKSGEAQRWYKGTKLLQLATAAAIPVVALLKASEWVPGVLGAVVVVVGGAEQLYRHHEHWITYRSTCEALHRERFLFLAGAGPYARTRKPTRLLAERVEALVSQEHQRWASNQDAADEAGDADEAAD